MKRCIKGVAALSLLCLATACRTEEPKPLPAAPVINSFTADRAEILPGETALLRYQVSNADEVTIVTVDGDALTIDGDATGGTAKAMPSESTIYVLRARGPGGRAAAFVQVAVGEPLASVFLMAVPPEVDPGQQVDLVWSAQGAKSVELRSAMGDLLPTQGTSGAVPLTPTESKQYTLTATGPDGAKKAVTTTVKVRPTIERLTAEPGVVNVGDEIVFNWKTAGADTLVITEKTFGELYRSPTADSARGGFARWKIPATLPGTDEPLLTGFRLEFTVALTSAATDATLTKTIVRHLGQGPVISAFRAPELVGQGKEVTLSWEISGADRIQIFANGLLVSEPRAPEMSALSKSSVVVPAPTVTTKYELVIHGFAGATASASRVVELAKLPTITLFSATSDIAQAGDAAMASWKTLDATQVQIRIKNGPVVYSTNDPANVANGSAPLRPGRTTTFVLDAMNAAGDVVESQPRTVVVSAPVGVVVTPSHPVPGQPVTVSWTLPPGDVTEVIGAPLQSPEKHPMAGTFVDLAALVDSQRIEFANPDEDVVELPASLGFRFPMAGALHSRFFASTNGFLALEASEPMPENAVALPIEDRMPALLAPLWDDLELGTGAVYYRADRTAGMARLTVQWNDVRLKGDSASLLKFQVQLFETGEVRFVYRTLKPGAALSADASATIGVNHDASVGDIYSANQGGAVAEGDELVWFNRPEPEGSFTVPLFTSTRFSLFYRRLNGELVNLTIPVAVWGQEALSIREAMPQPLIGDSGQWIELVNTTGDELPLAGLTMSFASGGSYGLPEISLLPGQTWIVGKSTQTAETDGVSVDWTIPGLMLRPNDEIWVDTPNARVSSFGWTSSVMGESVERDQRVVDSSGVTKVCPRTATYGDNGAKGTPGAPREGCWNYRLEPIAYAPTDILNSGEVLFWDDAGPDWKILPLNEHPFRLFDTEYSDVQVTRNGFVAFVYDLSDHSYFPAQPQITAPNGMLAPLGQGYWFRDIKPVGMRPPPYVLFRRVAPGELEPGAIGYYVAQWHRLANVSDDYLDVTFQVKFFDDGIIEYHYGMMTNGKSSTAYAEGEGGASWLENKTGTEALVINARSRTPGLQSYTGFRFTPL